MRPVREAAARALASPRLRRSLAVVAGLALVIGVVGGGYAYWRSVHRPNFELDPIDDLAEFTFLRGDFNSLPIQERLKLVRDFADRLRSASSADSALLASFAGGISGKAREQIQENGSRLMLDLADASAVEYAKVPKEKRGEFLERTALEWGRLADQIAGREPRSDEEILEEAREQNRRRDARRERASPEQSARISAGFLSFINSNLSPHSNPIQQQRTLQLMSDMTAHFSRER